MEKRTSEHFEVKRDKEEICHCTNASVTALAALDALHSDLFSQSVYIVHR